MYPLLFNGGYSFALFASCYRNYCNFFSTNALVQTNKQTNEPILVTTIDVTDAMKHNKRTQSHFWIYLLLLSFDVIDSFSINFISLFEVRTSER